MTLLYPVLLGLYPLLYLWNANRAQQPAYVILPALAVSLLYLLAVRLAARRLLRDEHNAALAAALVGFVTLASGQLAGWLAGISGLPPGLLLALNLLLLAAALAWIARRRPARAGFTRVMGLITTTLVLVAVLPAAFFYLFSARTVSAQSAPFSVPVTGAGDAPASQRDVYFILIDNYSRADVLRDRFGFDNTALIDGLKARGFILPACPQTNYPGTALAVASILNMDYLDQLGLPHDDFYIESRYQMLKPYIHNSAVLQKFAAYGYQTVTYRGYSDLLDIQAAGYYVSAGRDQPLMRRAETLNFQALYLETTLFGAANAALNFYPAWVEARAPAAVKKLLPGLTQVADRYRQVYRQNVYALDELERIPAGLPGPKFVYAHLYAAHWPYLLNPDGSLRLPPAHLKDEAAYLDGVRYLNSRLLAIIDAILAESRTPPVIILQSDHSNILLDRNHWSGPHRVKILNAYYLPDGGEKWLHDRITPVNNFRLVFHHYFGETGLPLLPDITYGIDPLSQDVVEMPATCIE